MTGRRSMPLPRRTTDRIEDAAAWVLMSAALLVALAGAVVGFAVGDQIVERGHAEVAARTQVQAVLEAPAPTLPGAYGRTTGTVRAPAEWTAPDGTTRRGFVPSRPGFPAGSPVTVWIDHSGALATAPVQVSDAVVEGVAGALDVLTAGACLLAAARVGVRYLTGVRNAAHWGREWAQVGPRWSRDLRS